MNKITNTRVGDNINYFVNGVEDNGIVVKMNNAYVTIVKDGKFKDIQLNETFFVKDIILNKTWDDMDSIERIDALNKAHAGSPRYVTKTWDQIPKDLQVLLTKNNSSNVSATEGKDDDENVTVRIFDKEDKLNSRNQRPLDPNSDDDRSFGEIRAQEESKVQNEKDKLEKASEKLAAITGDANYKRKPKGEGAVSNAQVTEPKSESGGFKLRQPLGGEGSTEHGDHGATGKTRQDGIRAREPSIEEEKGVTRGGTDGQAEGNAWGKLFSESTLGGGKNDPHAPAPEGKDEIKQEVKQAWVSWLSDRKDDVMKDGKDDKGNQFQQQSTSARGKNPTDSDDKLGRADKSWKEMLEEIKSNVENSVHGNAGRNPDAGVSTSTNFDAPKDYEGASHSGIRLEQFKHEKLKPKTKEQIDLGDTKPSDTHGGGNKYDTPTESKTIKGRAVDQEKDKKI